MAGRSMRLLPAAIIPAQAGLASGRPAALPGRAATCRQTPALFQEPWLGLAQLQRVPLGIEYVVYCG